MKVLVAGGAGFIGSHLVKALLQNGHQVRVLDICFKTPKKSDPNLEFILGGMEYREVVDRVMENIDVVYHLALFGHDFSQRNYETFDVNIKGTLNLLESARVHKVKHFLFSSSSVVYGRPRYLPIEEEHPCNPEEVLAGPGMTYGIIKLTTEKLCMLYYHQLGLPVTVLRVAAVFSDDKVFGIDSLVEAASKVESIEVLRKSGFESVHIEEVVEAFLLATLNENAYGQVFGVSNPNTFMLDYELTKFIIHLINSKSEIKLVSDDKLIRSMPDSIEKIQRLLGWKPRMQKEDFKEAIKRYLKKRGII
ncbi:MAG: NAD(P)-dependent oxidoreductase [Candidatus Bathyarchaeota archaeon]|nr:NAD(P)-dependent oxidoreductase [Candidatus Bathyarchaeota archaeon]